jgi:valyl-tRNA synthetase
MPVKVLEQWRVEREKIVHNSTSQGRELTLQEQQELVRLYSDKVESYLNAGHGRCYLRESKIAELVANTFKHFDGERYDLIAWAIMPNHIHVVLIPREGVELSEILHSWKSYTATQANKLLNRTGDFWHSEYYDHLIRDEEDFAHQVNYVLSNPIKAGLENWPWVGAKMDSHGQDARATIEYVTVATTRPETMLGDTAVAMNPADPRAKYLIGKKVRLPIVGRIIPIIADEHVVLPEAKNHGQDARGTDTHGQDARDTDEKARFSTGFLKVTPAHDPDDWEIGQRHNLEVINVLAPDGSISDKHGWTDWEQIKNPDVENLIGMDRFEAREAIVERFREEGLLEETRPYSHEVGHSYRSHVPIEPYLSDQWYIAVKKPIEYHGLPACESTGKMPVPQGLIEGTDVPVNSLAGLALKPLLDGRLRFIPDRYAKTYQAWLENLRDWPISRQLWWGHRIPIWYCRDCGQTNSGMEDPKSCEKCGRSDLLQDPDVLDTWFSSALWPFSTMGWPDETPGLKTFYPGNVLCTAREIITLWVSRMVMMGQYCVGDIPFYDVYIHAMIQDGEGRKMSKSLGNGIDPLTAIDSHGADAMRFTLASMTTQTQDIRMPVVQMTLPDGRTANTSPKFDIGRNFCNKLWNASRFAITNLDGIDPDKFDKKKMSLTDRWILSRLAQTIAETTEALDEYKYSEPLSGLYKFFWNDFCDWYLEWIKPRMKDESQKPIAQNILAFVLDQTLRLLHPFIPFITEGIFQKLNEIAPVRKLKGLAEAKEAKALVAGEWPNRIDFLVDDKAEEEITIVQGPIRAVRDIKSKYNVAPSAAPATSVDAPVSVAKILNANADLVRQLGGVKDFKASTGIQKPQNAATAIVDGIQIYVHDMIDTQAERRRLEKQKQQLEQAKKAVEAKLTNENFLQKAKPQVVTQAKDRLAQLSKELETVEKHLAELENSR